MRYSKERKEAVIRKMLRPHNKSVPVIAREEGISEPTLYAWRAAARAKGLLLPKGDTTPEGWTSADKFAVVVETAALNEEQKAEYCRGRGIYPEQLDAWRQACMNANDWDEAQSKKIKESMKETKKRTQDDANGFHLNATTAEDP
jgi:transposase-like protein